LLPQIGQADDGNVFPGVINGPEPKFSEHPGMPEPQATQAKWQENREAEHDETKPAAASGPVLLTETGREQNQSRPQGDERGVLFHQDGRAETKSGGGQQSWFSILPRQPEQA